MAKWTLAALVIATAACGGKGKGPATGTMNSGPSTLPVPAPHYAALFKDGATWTYATTSTAQGGGDPDDTDKHETKDTVTCKVASTGKIDGGVSSTITCDKPLIESGGDPLAGRWVATADGLYKFETELTTPIDFTKGRLVIAAAPTEGHKEKESGQDPVESESWQVTRSGDTWCAAYTMAAGDESFETLCFAAAGVVKGSGGWAGGSVHETSFVLQQ